MTSYERWCRVLLTSFPAEYRAERTEEMVGVLLDGAESERRFPSVATAADLVATGLRTRARLSTHGRAAATITEGLRLAAIVGLCLQAAFSVAMVAHNAHDGRIFYLVNTGWSTAAHGRLAALWVAAFVLVVAGRPRLAIIPSVVASAGAVILLVVNFHGGSLEGSGLSQVLLAVQMTLLGLVPTASLVVSSTRRSGTTGRHSLLWLVAFVGLAAVLSRLSTGVQATAGGHLVRFPPVGGLVSFLFWTWLAALLVTGVAGRFDPRLGVAVIAVSVPLLVYQVGIVISFGRNPTWPAMLVIPALAVTALVAVSSAASLRHLRAG